MAESPLDVLAGHPVVLVLGKGGVGKSTTAAALALAAAERGRSTHLISTDPAHSLGDVLGEPIGGRPVASRCHGALTVEEFDAQAYARAWIDDAAPALAELIERGTLLDAQDAEALAQLSLPGVDEVMGALRLAELASGPVPVVVDTAPISHTLRLLDAANVVAGWTDALQAMADKAAAVASGLTGRRVRLAGEAVLDRLAEGVVRFRDVVLGGAALVVAYRNEHLVRGDTALLLEQLEQRGLQPALMLAAGPPGESLAAVPGWWVPWQDEPRGCAGLRRWVAALQKVEAGPPPPAQRRLAPRRARGAAADWLRGLPQRLLVFAGKGGVGKTTCAAGAALVRAGVRRTVLFGTESGGSLAAVLGLPAGTRDTGIIPGLRLKRVDAVAEFERLREEYRRDVRAVFERLGLDASLRMDRGIIERLWGLAPPGVDELVAMLEISSALEGDESLVIDAAPTGHFLRLLAMPALAREWTDALMRVFLHLRAPGLEETVEGVLQFSRRLKRLTADLNDAAVTSAIAVTLDEPVVRAEMDRLRAALAAAHIPVAAWIVNRAPTSRGRKAVAAAVHTTSDTPVFLAPLQDPPPGGIDGLRRFVDAWERVR